MLVRQWLHKVYHTVVKQDKLYENYDFVSNFQNSSPQEIRKFQISALRKLLIHADANVPYYKNLFTDLSIDVNSENILSEFTKIPFLTKEIIRENFNDFKALNLPAKRFKKNSTSGSTGSNLIFFSDNEVAIRQALVLRSFDWMGKKFTDKELKIWGAAWDVTLANKIIPGIKSKFKSSLVVSGYRLSDDDFCSYIKLINTYKPYLLTSYPSILFAFANYLKKSGSSIKISAIMSAGEKLHNFQRELIEDTFKAKVFDFFGARDLPMIAMQCGHDPGLHIMAENVFLEVVDDKGNLIEEGEGDLVLTDFHNYVFPFIRYRIGDRVRISKRKCVCGRDLPLIEEVIGRTFDIIQFPNGNRVGGTFWTFVMKSVPGIKDFQVVQEEINHFIIKYIPDHPGFKIETDRLSNNIKEYGGQEIFLDFQPVEEIALTKGGKHQFIIAKPLN